jgi:putative ABC transport system permease protein
MPGYFDAMGIPVLRGRSYAETDRVGSPGVIVVNEAFADFYFPGEDAVGKRIGSFANDGWVYGREWLTIVGVVGNVRHRGLTSEPRREIYVNGLQRPMRLRSGVVVARTGGDPADLVGPIRARLAALDPEVPADFATMESIVSASTSDRRFLMIVLAVFATVALTLSAVGIYGVVSYTVARRRREMGIRLALGAAPGRVRSMVIRNAMQMVLIGIVAGILGARLLSRSFEALLWLVSPTDSTTIAIVVVLLAGTAWIASFVPALRGSRVDPLVTMRSD